MAALKVAIPFMDLKQKDKSFMLDDLRCTKQKHSSTNVKNLYSCERVEREHVADKENLEDKNHTLVDILDMDRFNNCHTTREMTSSEEVFWMEPDTTYPDSFHPSSDSSIERNSKKKEKSKKVKFIPAFYRFPHEIWCMILRHCDLSQLLALNDCCRDLKDMSTALIQQEFLFPNGYPCGIMKTSKICQFDYDTKSIDDDNTAELVTLQYDHWQTDILYTADMHSLFLFAYLNTPLKHKRPLPLNDMIAHLHQHIPKFIEQLLGVEPSSKTTDTFEDWTQFDPHVTGMDRQLLEETFWREAQGRKGKAESKRWQSWQERRNEIERDLRRQIAILWKLENKRFVFTKEENREWKSRRELAGKGKWMEDVTTPLKNGGASNSPVGHQHNGNGKHLAKTSSIIKHQHNRQSGHLDLIEETSANVVKNDSLEISSVSGESQPSPTSTSGSKRKKVRSKCKEGKQRHHAHAKHHLDQPQRSEEEHSVKEYNDECVLASILQGDMLCQENDALCNDPKSNARSMLSQSCQSQYKVPLSACASTPLFHSGATEAGYMASMDSSHRLSTSDHYMTPESYMSSSYEGSFTKLSSSHSYSSSLSSSSSATTKSTLKHFTHALSHFSRDIHSFSKQMIFEAGLSPFERRTLHRRAHDYGFTCCTVDTNQGQCIVISKQN